MPSEMRRIAAALVGTRTESFESRYSAAESKARVERALSSMTPRAARLDLAWHPSALPPRLEARFSPGIRTQLFLRVSSIILTLALVASAWVVTYGDETAARFLVPLLTVLAILGFPMAVLAVGSQREAEEARVVKLIRRAIVEAETAV